LEDCPVDAIVEEISAAAKALEQASMKINLFIAIAETEEISRFGPEEFLAEVMEDIAFAAVKIQQVSKSLIREPSRQS
jgi:hypothetical protein